MAKLIDKSLFSVTDESGTVNMFSISLPVFFQLIINQLIAFITTALISNFDPNLVTAMNASNTLISILGNVCYIASNGLAIILAHDLGKGDKKSIENLVFNALMLGGVIVVVLAIIFITFNEQFLSLMNLNDEVMKIAKPYYLAQVVNVGISVFGTILVSAMRCYGKVKLYVVISMVQVSLSATCMALFIYTPLGSYADMVTNITIRNITLTLLALTAIFVCIKRNKIKIGNKFNPTSIKRILRVGVPGTISIISYNLSAVITTVIIASLAMEFINFKVYINYIVTFVAYFGQSLGSGSAVLIGRAKGSGRIEKVNRMHQIHLRAIITINLCLSLVCLSLSKPLFSIFDSDPNHYALIWQVFLIDVVVEIGRGGNHACEGTLNAVGDVRYTTIVSILSCWLNAVGLSFVFVNVLNWGIVGVWLAFAIDEWTRAVLYEIRWRKGRWVNKVI